MAFGRTGSRTWYSEEDVKFLSAPDQMPPQTLLEALASRNYPVATQLASQGQSLSQNTAAEREELLFQAAGESPEHLGVVLKYLSNQAGAAVTPGLIGDLVLSCNYDAISKLGEYQVLTRAHVELAVSLWHKVDESVQLVKKYVSG
jgi:hypothetical protein